MSEISSTAFKLIYDLEKTAELCGYVKTDTIDSKRTTLRLELRDYIASLEAENAALKAELEAETAELKERVAILDITAVYKSLGEMGYIEQVTNLKAENAALQSRIAELEAGQCWTPVSEGLPELDQDVFAVVDGELDRGHFYQQWDGEVFFSSDEKGAMMVATHWMPLPTPPEVK